MNLGLAKRDSSWIGVLPVRAATAAKETVDGEGGFGDGGVSRFRPGRVSWTSTKGKSQGWLSAEYVERACRGIHLRSDARCMHDDGPEGVYMLVASVHDGKQTGISGRPEQSLSLPRVRTLSVYRLLDLRFAVTPTDTQIVAQAIREIEKCHCLSMSIAPYLFQLPSW